MVALDFFAAFHRVEGAMVSEDPVKYMVQRFLQALLMWGEGGLCSLCFHYFHSEWMFATELHQPCVETDGGVFGATTSQKRRT